MRRISDIGEFELIARIEKRANRTLAPGIALGIGDDAALLRARAEEEIAISTDVLVEDVHFRWSNQSPKTVGRRALAVNLSDLAAMGARPLGCTLSLALPGKLALRDFDGLIAGFVDATRRFGCPLVGGNIARAAQTSVNVTAIGAVKRGRALLRSRGLRAGSRLFVTGTPGAAALARLRSEREKRPLRHLPTPRLEAGRALGRMRAPVACIDISDGLLGDLLHMLEGTKLGARLDLESIPRARGFASQCAVLGLDPWDLCLNGGEDYELLFALGGAASRGPSAAQLSRRLGVAVAEIGSLTRQQGISGLPDGMNLRSWRHF